MRALIPWWERPDRDDADNWPTNEQLVKLYNLPHGCWLKLEEYFLEMNVIARGASHYLGKELASDILADTLGWLKRASDFKAEKERLKREAEEQKSENLRRIKNIEKLKNNFGSCDFDKFTARHSPRPRQFEFVRNFFSEDQEDNREEIQNFREENFGTGYRGLFLHGPSQVTKSASAWLAAKTYIETFEESAKFVSTSQLASLASQKHTDKKACQEFNELVAKCLAVDFLILDDLGTEGDSGKAYESAIYQIIEDRRKYYGYWTIITCNYDPDGLCKRMFTDANKAKILSRLKGYYLPIDFNVVG